MRTDQFFRCLADQTRLNIVLLLWHCHELSLTQLANVLNLPTGTLSRNLALLVKHNILCERSHELDRYFRINSELPAWAYKILKHTYIGNKTILEPQLQPLAELCS